MRVDILLSCGKHIHDCIISFTGDAWAHKTSLTPSHFFYWSACTKPGKWDVICMYLYIRGIDFVSFYDFLLTFRTVPTVWCFSFLSLLFFPHYITTFKIPHITPPIVKTEIGLSRCDWFFITLIVDSTK
jgi:hypothetical protein